MLLVVILISVLGTIIFSLPYVQTRLANYATNTINNEFGTNINIEGLRVSMLTWDALLKGVYIEDYQKDTLFYINELSTSILSVRNLSKGKLEFGNIDIDKLNFKLRTYKDTTSSNLEVFIDKLDDKKPRKPGTPPFFFSSSSVEINNSAFKLIDDNLERSETLDFEGLQISATDFLILGPDVSTNINAMSFKDQRDIKVNKLTTQFKYTKQQMRFDTLRIETPESDLKGNLVFDYDRKDFKEFLDKVRITASFVESTVSLDEINLLYDQFGKGISVSFSSNMSGVLNDLNAEDLFLQTNNTGIRGDFNFKNLFSREASFIMEAKMKNVTSSYYELRSLMPNILGKSIPSTFSKIGQFTIRGERHGDREFGENQSQFQYRCRQAVMPIWN